ncbi:unnamed protein product, partial [Symbiodinium sp. KB8]
GPFHKSTLSELGEYQNFTHQEVGAPLKHHFASQKIFFDSPDLEAVKSQEGDCCLGIKAYKPHHTTTYSDLGNIPKWPKKRYDFGPIANTRYRPAVSSGRWKGQCAGLQRLSRGSARFFGSSFGILYPAWTRLERRFRFFNLTGRGTSQTGLGLLVLVGGCSCCCYSYSPTPTPTPTPTTATTCCYYSFDC